ncbi:hypothetical protein A2165_00380 [Candidatus Curtissbacteria bacterium RBG_13_40_7]|uniref:Uncharacterized protein n=1 Tax=Candidatus Curtissbacteria bacterium RBG_13_40_7 TaxID=1797706 RepID=A0A1F5FTE8_9BACT|nr:MAG: hypothetical protein A2165_00380 [Candidatus Curtissbacteria bacterium RBG_13_40_7]
MKRLYSIFLMIIIFNIFLPFHSIMAITTINPGFDVIEKPLGMSTKDVRIILADLIHQAMGFLGIVFVVMILYGGFAWMISMGDEEKVKAAKNTIVSSVIGIILVITSYSIVNFIFTSLLNAI